MKTNRRMQRSSGKPGSLRPRSKTQQLISDLVVVIVNFLWMVEIVGWLSFCPLCFFLWRFLVHTFFQAKARVSYNLWETGHLQNNQTFASPVFNLKWTCIFIMIFQVRNVLFWVDCHFHVPWNHQGQTARSYVVGLGQRSNTDPQAAHPPPKKTGGNSIRIALWRRFLETGKNGRTLKFREGGNDVDVFVAFRVVGDLENTMGNTSFSPEPGSQNTFRTLIDCQSIRLWTTDDLDKTYEIGMMQ